MDKFPEEVRIESQVVHGVDLNQQKEKLSMGNSAVISIYHGLDCVLITPNVKGFIVSIKVIQVLMSTKLLP